MTNETKHTPCFASLLDEYGVSMYEEGKHRGRDEGTARKRKALLAIHVGMLVALRAAVDHVEASAFRENAPWLSAARAALAKAGGRRP